MSYLQFWNLTKSTCWMLAFVMTMKLGFPRVPNQFCFFSISEETIWVLNAQNIPWSCNLRTHRKLLNFWQGANLERVLFASWRKCSKKNSVFLFCFQMLGFNLSERDCHEHILVPRPAKKNLYIQRQISK